MIDRVILNKRIFIWPQLADRLSSCARHVCYNDTYDEYLLLAEWQRGIWVSAEVPRSNLMHCHVRFCRFIIFLIRTFICCLLAGPACWTCLLGLWMKFVSRDWLSSECIRQNEDNWLFINLRIYICDCWEPKFYSSYHVIKLIVPNWSGWHTLQEWRIWKNYDNIRPFWQNI